MSKTLKEMEKEFSEEITSEYIDSKMNTIIHADCLEVMKKIPDNYFDLIFTSPPYNRLRNDKYAKYDDTIDDYYKFLVNVVSEILRISKRAIFNIQAQSYNRQDVYKFMGNFSDKIQENIIWEKSNPLPACGDAITNAYEFFIMFGDTPFKTNSTYIKNILTTSVCGDMPKEHKAVMKTEVAEYFLTVFRMDSRTVFDPFMGIGTTAVTCKSLGLDWCGCELEEDYVAIGNKRLEKVQGALF